MAIADIIKHKGKNTTLEKRVEGVTIMENIQYSLIHKILVGEFDNFECKLNDASLSYLSKLKQAYDNFSFCLGKGYTLDIIVAAYEDFYSMVDARIPCLFSIAHDCKCELLITLNRSESFEEHSYKECFCSLRNCMFKL